MCSVKLKMKVQMSINTCVQLSSNEWKHPCWAKLKMKDQMSSNMYECRFRWAQVSRNIFYYVGLTYLINKRELFEGIQIWYQANWQSTHHLSAISYTSAGIQYSIWNQNLKIKGHCTTSAPTHIYWKLPQNGSHGNNKKGQTEIFHLLVTACIVIKSVYKHLKQA